MYRIITTAAVAGILVLSTSVLRAQIIEEEATPEETAAVLEALEAFECVLGPSPVEKEGENQFEIDDADCAQGQYDIKLTRCPECGALTVMTMTFDGPKDVEAFEEEATAEEVAEVEEAIAAMNCRLGEGEVEKETPNLFEIDDAICDAGQFDIKLDGDYNVINLTLDLD